MLRGSSVPLGTLSCKKTLVGWLYRDGSPSEQLRSSRMRRRHQPESRPLRECFASSFVHIQKWLLLYTIVVFTKHHGNMCTVTSGREQNTHTHSLASGLGSCTCREDSLSIMGSWQTAWQGLQRYRECKCRVCQTSPTPIWQLLPKTLHCINIWDCSIQTHNEPISDWCHHCTRIRLVIGLFQSCFKVRLNIKY